MPNKPYLFGQRLSSTKLGHRFCSRALTKHNTKRVDRLSGKSHLHQERAVIYQFLCGEFFNGHIRPVIVVDWSDLNKERDYHSLSAAVQVGGRTLTLHEYIGRVFNLELLKLPRKVIRSSPI